jgi:serine/threonine protein kinase
MSIFNDLISFPFRKQMELTLDGRYLVLRTKSSANGLIALCRDLVDRNVVVVKAPINPREKAIRAFREEGLRWRQLEKHDNIVQLFRVFHLPYGTKKIPCLVLEFVNGLWLLDSDLRFILSNGHSLPIRRALGIALQLSEGMEYAKKTLSVSGQNTVHGDLKPENILLDNHLIAKISDFGINAPTKEYLDPFYPSLAQPTDYDADIFSFGCVLFEMLAGDLFFQRYNESNRRKLRPLISRTFSQWNRFSGAGDVLAEIVHKCLCVDLTARYQSFSEIKADLKSIWEKTQKSRPPVPTPRQTHARRRIQKALDFAVLGFSREAVSEYVSAFQQGVPVLEEFFSRAPGFLASSFFCINENNKLVFLIFDDYGNFECQSNISAILKLLLLMHKLRLIIKEGGVSGKIDLSFYRRVSDQDPDATLRLTEKFLEVGVLSGTEAFAIGDPEEIVFLGGDNERLHERMVELYFDLEKNRKKYCQLCLKIDAHLETVQRRKNSSLANFEVLVKTRGASLETYAEILLAAACEKSIVPNNVLLSRIAEIEKLHRNIDYSRKDKEEDAIRWRLLENLPEYQRAAFIRIDSEYRHHKKESLHYWYTLKEFAQEFLGRKVFESYQNIAWFIQMITKRSEIDYVEVGIAFREMEDRIRLALCKDSEDEKILRQRSFVQKMEEAFASTLSFQNKQVLDRHATQDSWTEIFSDLMRDEEEKHKALSMKELRAIADNWPRDGDFASKSLERLASEASKAREFYELAERRSEILFDSVLRAMGETDQHICAVVVGGFHAQVLMQKFKEHQISFVYIYPHFKVTEKDHERLTEMLRKSLQRE